MSWWLLRCVDEFEHKDFQKASFVVTVIARSLKNHKKHKQFEAYWTHILLFKNTIERLILTCYYLYGFILHVSTKKMWNLF